VARYAQGGFSIFIAAGTAGFVGDAFTYLSAISARRIDSSRTILQYFVIFHAGYMPTQLPPSIMDSCLPGLLYVT